MTSPREEDRLKYQVAPNVQLSSTLKIPNNIKVRKKVEIWPLKLSAGLDYNFARDRVRWVATCKEKVFDGKITLDLNSKTVGYRKVFRLEEGGPSFCVQAGCPYTGTARFKPTVGVNFLSGSGKRSVMSVGTNSFDLRRKVPISRRLRAEVCANVKLPTFAPQYTAGGTHPPITLCEGDGMFEIHVAEVNALIYV